MNAKKIFFVVMLLCGILLFTSAANAGWYRCTVNETGVDPTNGITYINLTMVDLYAGSGTWTGGRWFMATGDYKSLLAVGLSAIASNSYVTVNLASDPPVAYSVIIGIFQRNYGE
jgi:hypothetical protein